MVLKRFFKGKRKIGLPESVFPSLPSDPSKILAKELPPLVERGKSPSDVLDFLGYPNSILAVTNDDISEPPSSRAHTYRPHPHQYPIRPIDGLRRPSFHNYSYDDDQQRKRAAATPPTLMMPQPIIAVPPTRDTVLYSSSKDKTLVPVQGAEETIHEEKQQENATSSGQCSSATLQGLYEQLENYRLKHQVWLHREREHQKTEKWMIMKLYDVQTQLDQLTAHVDSRHHKILNEHEDKSSGYVSEEEDEYEDEDEDEEHQHDHEGVLFDRRRYYYQPMCQPLAPIPYRRHNSHTHQHIYWPAPMIPNTYHLIPHHRSHNSLRTPPPMVPRFPLYPRYMHADPRSSAWGQKSLDGSFVFPRKQNSIQRRCSTDRFCSRRAAYLI